MDLSGLLPHQAIALQARVSEYLTDIASAVGSTGESGVDDLRFVAAAREVGIGGDILEALRRERQFKAAVREWGQFLFTTVSGAHLYGFPSPDSDVDLRGAHVLPAREVLGLKTGPNTVERSHVRDGLQVDLVTHDVHKFFTLLLRRYGYVLEQLCSPLVVHKTPEHQALKALMPGMVTRHHAHHYVGFAHTQWRRFQKESRVKPLLYVYRVLLTGIHLMRTGEVEANLLQLNETFGLPYIPDLVAQKIEQAERATRGSCGQ